MLVGASAPASSRPSPRSTSLTLVKVLPKSASATTPTGRLLPPSGRDAAGPLDQRVDQAVDRPRRLDPARVEVGADVDRDLRAVDVLVQHAPHEDRDGAGVGAAELVHQPPSEGAGDA